MKQTLLVSLNILFCVITFAQSVPQGINYQAVARDANGDVLMNQALRGVRISEVIQVAVVTSSPTVRATTPVLGLLGLFNNLSI